MIEVQDLQKRLGTQDVLRGVTMTVKRGWAMARAWLHRELTGESD